MTRLESLNDPWLVTAWPGPGGVGLAAAGHLVDTLRATLAWCVDPLPYFPLEEVRVRDGVHMPGRRPRSTFFSWRDPAGRRDLVIFIGEAIPVRNGRRLCGEIVEAALRLGVRRIVPFASMGTRMHPAEEPRVFCTAPSAPIIDEAVRAGAETPVDGSIEGINGGLIATATARGLQPVCLSAELPMFAMGIPNPRSSRSLLEVFAALTDISLDSTRLDAHVAAMEQPLRDMIDLVDRLRGLAGHDDALGPGDETALHVESMAPVRSPLSAETVRRIETLFEAARTDDRAVASLKLELDRLGVFTRYEDRFLDLFARRGCQEEDCDAS